MHLLQKAGAEVSYADPYVPELPAHEWPGGVDMKSVTLDKKTMESVDCVVIVTDHKVFNYDEIVLNSALVIDTRNATTIRAAHVVRLGAPLTADELAAV
jgi:UDP-N-acetyl-D-glucosamine dehydrogenase